NLGLLAKVGMARPEQHGSFEWERFVLRVAPRSGRVELMHDIAPECATRRDQRIEIDLLRLQQPYPGIGRDSCDRGIARIAALGLPGAFDEADDVELLPLLKPQAAARPLLPFVRRAQHAFAQAIERRFWN